MSDEGKDFHGDGHPADCRCSWCMPIIACRGCGQPVAAPGWLEHAEGCPESLYAQLCAAVRARAAAGAAVERMVKAAGDALGTDPELRNEGCVEALARWAGQLRDELAREIGRLRERNDALAAALRELLEAGRELRTESHTQRYGERWERPVERLDAAEQRAADLLAGLEGE